METAAFKKLQGIFQVLFAAYGQGMQRTCRSLYRIGIHRYAVLGGNNNGIHRRTLASTGYRSEITHIRYAVQHHKQRILAFLKKERYKVFRFLIGHGGDKCYHPLMVLTRNAVDTLHRHTLYGNQSSL